MWQKVIRSISVKRDYILDLNNIEIPGFSSSLKDNNSISSDNCNLQLTANNLKSSIKGIEIEKKSLKSEKQFDFRVIVCDDEKLIVCSIEKLFHKIMEKRNLFIDVKIALDGAECIYFLYQGIKQGIHYDAIISDENMDFIKGSLLFEIINKLKSNSIMYDVKLILSTASDSFFNNIGANIIFEKPITQNHLEAVLGIIRSG